MTTPDSHNSTQDDTKTALETLVIQDSQGLLGFHWNEGPDGRQYTWWPGQFSVSPGEPLGSAPLPKTPVATDVYQDCGVDQQSGQTERVVTFITRQSCLDLTERPHPRALARLIDLYLQVCGRVTAGQCPDVQLQVMVGPDADHAQTLTFTPRLNRVKKETPTGWALTIDMGIGQSPGTRRAVTLNAALRDHLRDALGDIVRDHDSVTASYLHSYRALYDLINERHWTDRDRRSVSAQLSPQNVRIERHRNREKAESSIDTAPLTMLKAGFPDYAATPADVTDDQEEPHLRWRSETGHACHLPIDPELSLLLTLMLPLWMAGEDHELSLGENDTWRVGVQGQAGVQRRTLSFALAPGDTEKDDGTFLPRTPPALLVQIKDRAKAHRQTNTLLLGSGTLSALHRATFAQDRATLTGAPRTGRP